jgi:phage terminase small subunit
MLRFPQKSQRNTETLAKLEITADRVLQEIAKLAFFDPRNFFEDDGSLKRIQDLDEHTRMALAGLEVMDLPEGNGRLKKIRLADKGQNLERLGKHLKLFTDKTEHSGRMTLEQLVCAANYPKEEPSES